MRATVNGHQFDVDPGETLVEAGRRSGLAMPYSCLRGDCGTCLARLEHGEVDMPPLSEMCLNAGAVADRQILMCVARPLGDVVVANADVRPTEPGDEPRPFVITKREQPAPDVLVLNLAAVDKMPVRYRPGQFVNVLTEAFGARSYSIARPSAPTGLIELHIRLKPDGQFTPWLFENGQSGTELIIEKPSGRFYCDIADQGPRVFVASGTGFAPIKAILEDLFKQRDPAPKWLYWGGRRPSDLYQDKLARNWTKLYPNFRYIPVVSDALAEDEWTGRRGFVHQAVSEDHTDMTHYNVYACGLPLMVDAARRDFSLFAGLRPHRFHADAFV